MSGIHGALGFLVLALALVLLATTLGSVLLGDRLRATVRTWIVDGLALVVEAAVLLTLLAGPLLLATGRQPADPLHFLYAVIAVAALPVALGIAMSRGATGPRRDRWLALGTVILGGVAVRLIQTG